MMLDIILEKIKDLFYKIDCLLFEIKFFIFKNFLWIVIPDGRFCYKIKEIDYDDNDDIVIKTKLCPFYNNKKGKCTVVNIKIDKDWSLKTKVKVCNIRCLED